MNTPKLSSTLSGIIGTLEPVRAGKSAQSLNFSQLLGEKHQQFMAPSNRPQVNNSAAGRGNETAPRAERRVAAQQEPAATAQNPTQGNNSTKPRQVADSHPGSSSRSQARDAGASQPAADNSTAAGTRTAAESGASVAVAANESPSGPQTDGDQIPAGTEQAVAKTPVTSELSGAALAQQAAEAGLLAVPATPAAPAVALPDSTAHPGQPTALQAQGIAPAVATAAPVPPAAASAEGPEAIPAPALPSSALPSSALPGNAAGAPNIDAAAPALAQMGNQQPADQPAASAAAQPSAAPSPATVSALLTSPAGSPAMPAPAAQAASATPDAAAATATHTLSLPLVADTVDTAAARSLQDFTAMVEAARAATGTTMPPPAGVAHAALPASGALAGLMPAGLFTAMPSQAPTMAGAGSIAAPLNSPQWPTELGRQFINIAQSTTGPGQVAELRLDPPELGPLRITINLNDNVAHAVFSSPHAAVRQTVEQALPQLQQMLEQAGISLGQADVSDQQQSDGQFHSSRQSASNRSEADAGMGASQAATGETRSRPADPRSLVDTFA